MKWSMFVGALVMSVSLCSSQQSYGFELLGRMLDTVGTTIVGCGCDAKASCGCAAKASCASASRSF